MQAQNAAGKETHKRRTAIVQNAARAERRRQRNGVSAKRREHRNAASAEMPLQSVRLNATLFFKQAFWW
ncbi:hypothetical protein A7K91_13940 [Paenibacillus oryzae]|uniref:Uncharacterized protein n=1 Tax=Paenibacillus oryzae TaxID=1844972 RepID=A0A1A5YJD1_9BACL|nr:hypothetical protein A7K91_13940 [Paenibacillus oryzae]